MRWTSIPFYSFLNAPNPDMSTNWKTIRPEETSLGAFHSYILAAIGPRPIAFVSTIDAEGRPNLAPFSFFNAFGTNPATLIFSPARRGKDNTTKHTLHNVEAIPECVINVVNYAMVEQVSLASTDFDEGVNEFAKAGFSQVASQFVKPFRVGESPAAFECKVEQVIKTGDQGGAGNLVVCRILAVHYQEHLLNEEGKVDQFKMDLVGRMGYEYYCRADAQSIFEVPKPRTKDILGFDGLPVAIRESNVLTGNQLARLANCKALPTKEEIDNFLQTSNLKDLSFDALIEGGVTKLNQLELPEGMLSIAAAYSLKN
jgi:flavin reductase (DIM6/NTAB) family NADH-FMN oxidoreductase RutF